MISLTLQEKLRKPLLGLTKLLHRAKLVSAWYQFTGPINRYLIWQSPFFKSFQPTLVVDIGANTGEFIMNARVAYPKASILAFEPHPTAIESLRAKYQNDAQLTIQPVGLGSQSGSSTLYMTAFSPSSSVIKPTTEAQEVSITIHTLDQYVDRIPANAQVLIKIDVEGYELEVLRGGVQFLSRANYVYLEVRTTDVIGCSFDEVYQFFYSIGWQYLGGYDSLYSKTGELIYFDALFKRKII